MKSKVNTLIILILIFTVNFFKSQAQTEEIKHEIKGKILDEASQEPLVGASVTYGKGKGVVTDIDGNFLLTLPNGDYVLIMDFVGYAPIEKKITVNGGPQVINPVGLKSENSLNEVEIASDIARTRETPIAFSDITAKQISRERGSNDMTMLLNSVPGAYATMQGGGAGDSRVTIRGFDQRYIGVLVDGVPVNDMENGKVYWSNWAGLSEITQKVQVQRGLGASRLALPAVGGVMNIITSPIDQEKSLVVRNDLGTNNYRNLQIAYNSGLIKNKFGFTLAGGYTGGDGYIDQTWQKTWSYFAKMSYKINSKSMIMLSLNGAPQSRGQRSFAINMAYHDKKFAEKQGINADSMYASNKYTTSNIGARGTTYSPDWGYLNGHAQAVKINYFHKPLFNLSYFLNANSRLSFSEVAYVSIGTGGGTTLNSFNGVNYDYAGTGQLDLQTVYNNNVATPAGTVVPGQSPAGYYIQSSVNNHKWVGSLSTIKYKITPKLDFLGGVDARYYVGTHYQTPYDYLGGNYVVAPGGKDLNLAPKSKDPQSYVKHIGDKINYYNDSRVSWLGLFAQVEHKFKKLTTFLTVTGNQTGYQYVNYFGKKDIELSKNERIRNAVGYGDTLYYSNSQTYGVPQVGSLTRNSDGSVSFTDNFTKNKMTIGPGYKTYSNSSPEAKTNTSKVSYYKGYTAKAGFNYPLNNNNNVFINAGYMNLVPKFNNVYDNYGNMFTDIKNQVILSLEAGYGIRYSKFAANLNGYMTKWGNKPADFPPSFIDPKTGNTFYYNPTGIDALLKGIEFDASYQPIKQVEVKAFAMFADWKWNSKGKAYVYSNDGSIVDTIVFDAKGVPIGNAPQRQLGGSIKFEPKRNTYIKIQYTCFSKMWAQFDPSNLQIVGDGSNAKDYRGAKPWQAPAYGIFDLYAGYNIASGKTNVDLFGTMNNVLNTVYLTDVFFPSGITPDAYNATNATGWFGLGRRFTIGIRVTL